MLLLLPDHLSLRVLQLTLQPEWRKRSTNAVARCENGDPLMLMLAQIDTMIINWIEGGVNWLVDRSNDFFDNLPWPLSGIGRPIRRFCMFNRHEPDKCRDGGLTDKEPQHFKDCEDVAASGGLALTCYYHRVRAPSEFQNRPQLNTAGVTPCLPGFPPTRLETPIALTHIALTHIAHTKHLCASRRLTLFLPSRSARSQVHTICSSDEMITEYDQLFARGFQDASQMHTQFADAFGDSFAYQDPALLDLIEQAHTSTLSGPDLSSRRDICSSAAFASAMRLDQIVRRPSACPRRHHALTTTRPSPHRLSVAFLRWRRRRKRCLTSNQMHPKHSLEPCACWQALCAT